MPRQPITSLRPSASGTGIVDEGSPYTLNLSATSSIGNNAISSWSVGWGDGASDNISGNPSSAQHTYYDGGNSYTINSTAYGGGQSFASGPSTVIVNDVPANIAAIASQSVNTGSSFSISTAFTDPGIHETHTGIVNWGDGTSSIATVNDSSGTISASHIYQTHGSYTPTLQVTDSAGAVASMSFQVTALYVAPSLGVVVPVQNAYTNTPITVPFYDYGPETTGVTSWRINWGDGTATETVTNLPDFISTADAEWDIPHSYTGAGAYTIQAVAIDSTGALPAVTSTISVAAQPVSGLTATAEPGTGNQKQTALAWTNNSNSATGSIVQRRLASSSTLPSSNWTTIATLDSGVNSYTDVPPDTTSVYQYQVVAQGITDFIPSNIAGVTFNPVVSIGDATSVLENSPITWTSAAIPPTGTSDPLMYSWTVTQNGVPLTLPVGTATDNPTLNLTPTGGGTLIGTLTVSDPSLGTSTEVSTPQITVGSLSLSALCVSNAEIDLTYNSAPGQQLELEQYNPLNLTYEPITTFTATAGTTGTFPVQGLRPSTHYEFRLRGTLGSSGQPGYLVQYVTAFDETMDVSWTSTTTPLPVPTNLQSGSPLSYSMPIDASVEEDFAPLGRTLVATALGEAVTFSWSGAYQKKPGRSCNAHRRAIAGSAGL